MNLYNVHAIADSINLYAYNPELTRIYGENGKRAVILIGERRIQSYLTYIVS